MHQISSTALSLSFDAMMAGLMLVIALVLRLFPALWTATVGRIDDRRIHTLDGARGVLTTWVLSHHLMMGAAVDAHGIWHPPAGPLGLLMTSDLFVAPFFMLTAMLFGGRLLARPGRMDVPRFLIGRAFRLLPTYLLATAMLVLGAFATAHFALNRPVASVIREVGRWMLFDFVARYDINGVDIQKQYGVLWTLRYEILFYLSLPVLALVQRWSGWRLVLIPALALLGLVAWPFIFFAAGVVAALLTRWSSPGARRWVQVAAVAGIGAVVGAAMLGLTGRWFHALCLIPALTGMALEVPLFAPLRWRPLRLVGEVSYSIYVLHAAIVFLMVIAFFDLNAVLALGIVQRIACLVAVALAVVATSVLSFVFVELPCIRLGKAATRWARRESRESGASPTAVNETRSTVHPG